LIPYPYIAAGPHQIDMTAITVKTAIASDIHRVWHCWTLPEHIVRWNHASGEWHCPEAENDLKPGGKFSWRMEAKDGSMGFDYSGTYEEIRKPVLIKKKLDDGRSVTITFEERGGVTELTEIFEPDDNDPELQRQGWQAILDNFRKYVESGD